MTLAQLSVSKTLPAYAHLLVWLPAGKTLNKETPYSELLASIFKRRNMKVEELVKSPVAANAADGTLVAWGWEMLRA